MDSPLIPLAGGVREGIGWRACTQHTWLHLHTVQLCISHSLPPVFLPSLTLLTLICRLLRLSEAFGAYTTDGLATATSSSSSSSTQQQQQQQGLATVVVPQRQQQVPTLSPAARDALLLVFSPRGSYVQELLVEEAVAAADALGREALGAALRATLGSPPAALALAGLRALGPLRPLALPFSGPLELAARLAPAVELTAEDEEALRVVRGVAALLRGTAGLGGAAAASSAPGIVFSSVRDASAADGSAIGGMPTAGLRGGASGGATPPTAAAAAMDTASALAALGQLASGAAGTAAQLGPLLPELAPGLAHTGQAFALAFVSRIAARLSDSLAADDEERALAMAALSFTSNPRDWAAGLGPLAASAALRGASSSALLPAAGAAAVSTRGIAGTGLPPATRSVSAWAAGPPVPLTVGQLVTGLAAAPLLAVLTPLALLSELQRRQRR